MGIWTFKAYFRDTAIGMKMGCIGPFVGTSGPPFSDERQDFDKMQSHSGYLGPRP